MRWTMVEFLVRPEFVTGVASGLAVAVLLWLGRYGVGWMLSAAQAALRRERSLSGVWVAHYAKGGQVLTEKVTLRQFGRWVWGSIENHNVDDSTRVFTVRGTVRHNVLVATYELPSSREEIDRGAFTLVVNLKGNKMLGEFSWIDGDADRVTCGRYEWRRVPRRR